jgi:hypothetical protein
MEEINKIGNCKIDFFQCIQSRSPLIFCISWFSLIWQLMCAVLFLHLHSALKSLLHLIAINVYILYNASAQHASQERRDSPPRLLYFLSHRLWKGRWFSRTVCYENMTSWAAASSPRTIERLHTAAECAYFLVPECRPNTGETPHHFSSNDFWHLSLH